jgi:hypothetical protein
VLLLLRVLGISQSEQIPSLLHLVHNSCVLVLTHTTMLMLMMIFNSSTTLL